jgi:DNA-binding transcriptional ArsR family regulator
LFEARWRKGGHPLIAKAFSPLVTALSAECADGTGFRGGRTRTFGHAPRNHSRFARVNNPLFVEHVQEQTRPLGMRTPCKDGMTWTFQYLLYYKSMDDTQAATCAALAHPQRLRIFRLLVREGPSGLPAGDVAEALGATPTAASFHLKELDRAGLISASQICVRRPSFRLRRFAVLGTRINEATGPRETDLVAKIVRRSRSRPN